MRATLMLMIGAAAAAAALAACKRNDIYSKHTATLGTRALDVLHVASAVTLGCRRFITYDARQARLARALKLQVRAP